MFRKSISHLRFFTTSGTPRLLAGTATSSSVAASAATSAITSSPSSAALDSRLLVNKHPDLAAELVDGEMLKTLNYDSAKLVVWTCRQCQNPWVCSPIVRSVYKVHICYDCKRNSTRYLDQSLLKEWSLAKNDPFIDLDTVEARSTMSVWWQCSKCPHEWKARIADRSAGAGCPKCAMMRQQALEGGGGLDESSERDGDGEEGEGSVKRRGPRKITNLTVKLEEEDLERIWHPQRNNPMVVSEAKPQTLAWWMCTECSGEWQATVRMVRSGKKGSCPHCGFSHAGSAQNSSSTTKSTSSLGDTATEMDL